MSKLIVMPGERAEALPPAIKADKLDINQGELLGHLLMLNLDRASHFSCGGFQVSKRYPTSTVTTQTQLEPIRRALKEGKLIDVTGSDIRKGVKTKTGEASALKVEDTGVKVYMGQNAKGDTFVVAPKTKKEQKRIEKLIKTTGTVPGEYTLVDENTSGLSSIKTEDIEPVKPTKRGRKSLVLCDATGKQVGTHEIPARKPAKKALKNARTKCSKRLSGSKRN